MQFRSKAEGRWTVLLCLFVLTLIAAVVIVPLRTGTRAAGKKQGLFPRTESHEPGIENYDIRSDKAAWEKLGQYRQTLGKSASAVADIRDNFVRGEEELKQRIPNAKVEYNSDIRTPEVITPDVWQAKIEWLTPASGAKRSEILRSFVKQYSSLTGVTDEQADSLKVTADYTNPDGNLSYAHLEQFINGIPVFRGEVKAGFTKDGQLIRVINNLAPGLDYNNLSTEFGDPAAAVRAAAGYINYELKASDFARNNAASNDLKAVFGEGDWATTAEKMYFPTEPGVAIPAWRVMIVEPVSAYYVIVDASTGTMLWRKNLVNDQTQSATYNVYRNSNSFLDVADSPAPLSPGPINPTSGTQGVNGTRSNVTVIGNEGVNSFNNLGWITDGANVTDGNNLEAGIDRDGTNGVDATQVGSPNRTFTTSPAWNPPPGNPAPGDDPLITQAQRGAVIQMFYVMNRYHDQMYRLGFTEQARNFQNDNFGRGGTGADRVSGEGQDSSGTNNANFFTAADGTRGRMQMYLWTGPTPDYDGTADAEVIIHEVTHGTSNRLHGNASGLSTNMSGGMGEGWGDFFAYTMLAEPTDPINGIYTTGGYATYLISAGFTGNYYYGIRRFPRAPITFVGANGKPHNPFTFKYINSDCNTNIGTTSSGPNSAFPRGPVGSSTCDQVHNIGEIWSSMLWEVRNRMVQRLGFTTGTTRVLQVVTDGMKLAPIGPTIPQERDAIIAAASAISAADATDVVEGFRVRGAGFSASVQNAGTGSNNTAVTEAFDLPNAVITNPFTVTDPAPGGDNDGFPEPGETVRLNVTVTNTTGATVNNVVVTASGGGNQSANFGNVANGQTVTLPIAYTIPGNTACGSSISTNLTLTSSIGTQAAVSKSFTVGAPVVGLTQNFDGVTAPALPSGWVQNQTSGTGITWVTSTTTPDSAPNAAFALDPAAVNAAALESPAFAVNSAAAALSFRINYNTESTFDGAVLEIKIGSGAWQDFVTAGGTFTAGGYNATISTAWGSPIGGRQAWSGNSSGYITTTATLPAAANGQNVQLRWLMASDQSVAATGVRIDNVQVVNSYTCTVVDPPGGHAAFDFDGDGKTDIGIFRPGAAAEWWISKSSNNSVLAAQFGGTGDQPVPADYTGDGKTDIAFFRPSNNTWYVLRSEDFSFYGFQFGLATDVLAPADYDGDGKADPAVFRNGSWFIQKSTGGTTIATFGVAGDKPVPADFDGDGKADIGIYRPNGGTGGEWWIQRSTAGLLAATFGTSTDKTAVGDYTGDGKADCAFFRPSTNTWYVLRSEDLSFFGFPFGISTDTPAPGDYDGDGKTDAAVFRSSGAAWFVNKSTGGVMSVNFGAAGDMPVPSSYVR